MKHALPLSVAFVAVAVAAAPALQTTARAPLPSCPNSIPHEPLVVYEVTGGTLSGPVDGFLAVYGDGLARYSSSIDGNGPGYSQTVSVGDEAAELHAQLIAAGALELCDQPDLVSDVPLSSLTVLRFAPRGRPNSFSWYAATDEQVGEIESLLSSFIGRHFTPPGGGGSER
jgi:hypothetical protein